MSSLCIYFNLLFSGVCRLIVCNALLLFSILIDPRGKRKLAETKQQSPCPDSQDLFKRSPSKPASWALSARLAGVVRILLAAFGITVVCKRRSGLFGVAKGLKILKADVSQNTWVCLSLKSQLIYVNFSCGILPVQWLFIIWAKNRSQVSK